MKKLCRPTASLTHMPAGGAHLASPRARYRRLRPLLLHSVSLTAMVVAGAAPARAGSFRSIAQAVSNSQAAVAAAATAGGAAAAAQAGLGAQNAANAASKFRSLDQALQGVGYTGPAVPDGVISGGLQQAPGVAGSSNPGTLWTGANTGLGVASSGGTTNVTVTQTSSIASLTWQSFNVGAHTKLIFDQSAGGSLASSWVAINSVNDPNANPSLILGQITTVNNTKGDAADVGKVYILNPNGILFGAGAQINVGGLIATTDVIAQSQYTRNAAGTITAFNLYGSATGTSASSYFLPTFTDTVDGATYTPGAVVVQAGASISTPAPAGTSTSGGGYVMLLGGSVTNNGEISTPGGQTILGAGDHFALQAGYSANTNPTATTIGSTIDTTLTGNNAAGIVLNTGIVAAEQGDITFVGHTLTQDGIVLSTTTVDQRGTVHFLTPTNDATASVTLGAGSVTEILPQDNGETALDSQRAENLLLSNGTTATATTAAVLGDNQLRINQIEGSVHLNTENTLADTLGESRIEISSGGNVDAQPGALALAQGGQVAVAAGGTILLESGASFDVSGVNASLAASANNLNIASIVPYYLRDSGANRTGGLEFSDVNLDQRLLQDVSYGGTLYAYTQGGLLEVSGNLGLIAHGINEWASIAGQVTLQAQQTVTGSTGGTVVTAPGSVINLTGGTVTYQAGLVAQSYVITTSGQIYNINEAPGNLVYAGVYTGETESHARWHIDNSYANPLLTPSEVLESAYTIGRDAGTLIVSASTSALDGNIYAGVTVGSLQSAARPGSVTDPFTLAQNVVPLSGALEFGDYSGGTIGTPFDSTVVLAPSNAPSGTITAVPDTVAGTVTIATDMLAAAGLSSITIATGGDISVQGAITAADGGSIVLSGQTIEDNANITARSGGITLTTFQPGSAAVEGGTATPQITVAAGVTLNAAGDWTNLTLDPNVPNAGGDAKGGSVSVRSDGGVDLAAGSTIDVSSGGLLVGGKLTTAAGGNVTISADLQPGTLTGENFLLPVTLGANIIGYGSGGAGTLSITAPQINITTDPQTGLLPNTLQIDPSLLSTGFASYDLTGFLGLNVIDGTQIVATRPIYVLNTDAASGAAPQSVYSVVLPSLFTQIKGSDALTQRAGASITLSASVNPAAENGGGGNITIAQGASVTVDPGQSINVNGYGQVTVLGTLTAHSGTITVANTRYDQSGSGSEDVVSNYQANLSVWLGSDSLIDASGLGVVMQDAEGRSFGFAGNGGTVLLGGLGGLTANSTESTYAQVIERPGAVIDAAGASVTVDVVQGLTPAQLITPDHPVTLVGNGGTIAARSYDGIALDGAILAGGGGTGAAGGVLSLRLDSESDSLFSNLPADIVTPQQIIVSQAMIAGQPNADLQPGGAVGPDTLNVAHISQAQIDAGGFATVVLAAPDGILLDGNVNLSASRAIYLQSPLIGDVQANATASVTAPYINLSGFTTASNDTNPQQPQLTGLSGTGTLSFSAGLIDIANQIAIGGDRDVGNPVVNGVVGGAVVAATQGFGSTEFISTGDIRFGNGELGSSGNLLFQADQLYPTTGASFSVFAGDNPTVSGKTNEFAGGTLTVLGNGKAAPQVPYSVGGTLALVAETVIQDGVVRAPLGEIQLGTTGRADSFKQGAGTLNELTNSVVLGDGSITSVSLDGLTVPYGGTVDGVNYYYDGAAVGTFNPVIEIDSAAFTAPKGASIDISGGGTLSGSAFVFGRGGSADVNVTPLLNTSSGTVVAGSSADQVYAILPGYNAAQAPTAPGDAGYTTPAIGEQITVQAGEVPGLAAGTYTLLPAYYDLLPGAFRVELTSAAATIGTGVNYGNFTTAAGVQVGVAGTDILSQLPQAALFTSSAGVQQLAQYDTENYSSFETNAAATFSTPRAFVPADAGTLRLVLNAPTTGLTANDQPVDIDPSALMQAPASGGVGATIIVSGNVPIDIVAPGQSSTTLGNVAAVGLDASMLDALDAPRLVIGGTLTISSAVPNVVQIEGFAPELVVSSGATLTAADIILTGSASALIEVAGGATLSTLGQSKSTLDLAAGYYLDTDFGTSAFPALQVSSTQNVFAPNQGLADGASINIDSGAAVLASGSLNFIAPGGTSVGIGQAELGGKYVNLQVANINIGSAATLAADASLLPSGLALDDAALATLVQGDAAIGLPAAVSLNLTATQAVNVLGSVALNSGTTDLTLYTPAIYGYGAATDAVSITAPVFTWGGVSALFATGAAGVSGSGNTTVSATPGAQIFGSASHVIGSLSINATDIVIGYGNGAQANDQVLLDHVLDGFSNVTLSASGSITANNQSAVTVYATQNGIGGTGAGGNLTLDTPVLTTASGAVLDITAGGSLAATATTPASQAAIGAITTLGGEINLTAQGIALDTAIVLPSGQLNVTSGTGIALGASSDIDLSGRDIALFDQTAKSNGGTLTLQAYAGANGNITQDAGGIIDVASPGAAAGAIEATASAGTVSLGGTLLGSGATGYGGGFTVEAASLGSAGFDGLNPQLDAGGFFGARGFELTAGDLTVDQTVTAHIVSIATDAGALSVTGTINASGSGPGTITLAAGGDLTLGATALIDAHATSIALDSYGQEINAENRAEVTLSSAAGTVTLTPGAAINVSYPDAANLQGRIVIDAPRTGNSVAVSATGSLNITGAAAIDVFGFITYSPGDFAGTIVQDNGSNSVTSASGTIGLNQIGAANTAYMAAVDANTGLGAQLAGLVSFGSSFNLAPGVIISSTAASGGNLTISGDLDFSGLRYSDVGFGTAVNASVQGSGEAGSVVFRAANNLVVNGSVTDGFAAPPDQTLLANGMLTAPIAADTNGWTYQFFINAQGNPIPTRDPDNADILLPNTTQGVYGSGSSAQYTTQIELAPGSVFATTRPISLNYDITVAAAPLRSGIVIPFGFTSATAVTVPGGGFIAAAPITSGAGLLYSAGQLVPGGVVLPAGTRFGAGSVLPVSVSVADNTTIPAGSLLDVFAPLTLLRLSEATTTLPDDAFIPAGTGVIFQGNFDGTTEYLSSLNYRPVNSTTGVQGYTYALAPLLPAGDQSWNLDFTAGANLTAANVNAVLPSTTLAGGAGITAPNAINQDPGSLILDDQHYFVANPRPAVAVESFSVIRTGTGDLSLNAGGSIDQSSLYGIYTAGTQSSLGNGEDAQFDSARQAYGNNGALLPNKIDTELVGTTYQAYYPTDGGNVSIIAGGDITGDVSAPDPSDTYSSGAPPSDSIGNWLWRQGSTQLVQPTAWWINFGTLVEPLVATGVNPVSAKVQLVGFQGIGALGGGNVTVIAGGDAGQLDGRGVYSGVATDAQRGEGLVIAIGGTGRLLPGSTTPITTGGGALTLEIAGTLNGLDAAAYGVGPSISGNVGVASAEAPGVNGDLIDLRGSIAVTAGAIGRIDLAYNFTSNLYDPLAGNPDAANNGVANGGITVAPGDGSVNIDTLRDLVLAGAADPGRVVLQNYTAVDLGSSTAANFGGDSGFTLWQSTTSIGLFSAGGNVTPITVPEEQLPSSVQFSNNDPTDFRVIYPPSLYVTAASGDIIYGLDNRAPSDSTDYPYANDSLETMPAPNGQITFLAANSIFANSYAIDLSGADPAGLASVTDPAFTSDANFVPHSLTNIRPNGGTSQTPDAIFALEADTPTTNLHANDPDPALFYAVSGDIVNFQTGETISYQSAANEPLSQWYIAAKPVWVIAGGDIISSGTRPSDYPGATVFQTQENQRLENVVGVGFAQPVADTSGNLVLNTSANSISVFSAGRDILSTYVYVGGPGTLEISAARNIYEAAASLGGQQQLFFGAFKSLGDDLISGAPLSTTNGAGIDVLAGIGTGADYAGFAQLYFNADNQANLALPITDPSNAGKVQQTYATALLAWLQSTYGYTGTQADAISYFLTQVPQVAQGIFVRQIFFEELAASGAQETDASSRFFGSYVRGRQAIDTLLPGENGQTSSNGVPAGYSGQITMFSGTVAGIDSSATQLATFDGGIATLFGGGVQVLDPGGALLLGITGGPAPGNSSGIVTYGSGSIDIFSLGSVLLGQSRIFTTSGGNILIWSANGDINAGVAVQTTIVFNPPLLDYDAVGDITETPPASSSGGGIATLQPLPQVPAGDISLIAPQGTIDAGEAGIRVSGNLVLAAARISGASNIAVKGSTSGGTTVATTSVGEADAASGAAGAATGAAQNSTNRSSNDQNAPSILEVEVVSIGGTYEDDRKKRKRGAQ